MPRGDSGRIVIEVEPEMKRQIYAALAMSGSTMKDWFVKTAREFCAETSQPSLFPPKTTQAKADSSKKTKNQQQR